MPIDVDSMEIHRALLERERDRIQRNLDLLNAAAAVDRETADEDDNDRGESASSVAERERSAGLAEHEQRMLETIEAAMSRLDAGTFGTCVGCGNEIAPDRLEAMAWADRCIDCEAAIHA